ncbi:MAG: iron-containing alcohol dehydrogenase [Cyclobacteriaceae bacterium]
MHFKQFEYTSYPTQVYFGESSFKKASALLSKYKSALVIASERHQIYVDLLNDSVNLYHFSKIIQHVPEALVEEAKAVNQNINADIIVAIGGGSAIGLAKALAIEINLEIMAIPTTYSGSEMTNIWGISNEAGKQTGRNIAALPKYVIYDPSLTASLPVQLAATSVMNALAHLIEAMYAHDSNPISYNNSKLGIKKLWLGIKSLITDGMLTDHSNILFLEGAFLAGKSLCEVSMSLQHKLAHILGGKFQFDHALVHSIILPYILVYQWQAIPRHLQEDLIISFDNEFPPTALQKAYKNLEIPVSLAALGFEPEDVTYTIDALLSNPFNNPKPLSRLPLTAMLNHAGIGTTLDISITF